jgi:hypothetical protein
MVLLFKREKHKPKQLLLPEPIDTKKIFRNRLFPPISKDI